MLHRAIAVRLRRELARELRDVFKPALLEDFEKLPIPFIVFE